MDLLGPITLRDKNNTSEKTAAQVHSFSGFSQDSRLYQHYGCLTPRVIRSLRKDPTVQLARWAILAPMIHTPWTYVNKRAGGKFTATQEMIDFVKENMVPLRDQFLQQAVFGTLDFGWQPFEVVYKPENGYIYIDNYKALLQDFTTVLVYINNGKFAGFLNQTYDVESVQQIEEKYAQITNFDIEGTDWYGYSIFDSILSIQNSWNAVEDTSGRFDRKIAGASYIVYYPPGKTLFRGEVTANDLIAQEILKDLIASGGVAIPDEIQDSIDEFTTPNTKGRWRIDLLEADSSSSTGFTDRQKYYDALKFRAFGFPERSIMEGNHGTKEEAGEHGDIALSIVDTRHRLICNALNLYSIPNLMTLNFGKKYAYSVGVEPAPIVDKQFAVVKEIYRLFLQNPETAIREFATYDLKAVKTLLNLPINGQETDVKFIKDYEQVEEDKKIENKKEPEPSKDAA